MPRKKKNIKEYFKISDIKNPWQLIWWFVQTKEFMILIIIGLAMFIILLVSGSFKYHKGTKGNVKFEYDSHLGDKTK